MPLPIGLMKELRMELETRGVLPPPTEQVGSSVLDPGTVDSSECDAVLVGPVSYTHLTLPTIYSV